MSLYMTIDAAQLRAALSEIEAAEQNGFNHCLAVFFIAEASRRLSGTKAEYSDMIERAHPTHERFDWGRYQEVSRENKFVRGELVPIKPRKKRKHRDA
jgi:hypothetical protein